MQNNHAQGTTTIVSPNNYSIDIYPKYHTSIVDTSVGIFGVCQTSETHLIVWWKDILRSVDITECRIGLGSSSGYYSAENQGKHEDSGKGDIDWQILKNLGWMFKDHVWKFEESNNTKMHDWKILSH